MFMYRPLSGVQIFSRPPSPRKVRVRAAPSVSPLLPPDIHGTYQRHDVLKNIALGGLRPTSIVVYYHLIRFGLGLFFTGLAFAVFPEPGTGFRETRRDVSFCHLLVVSESLEVWRGHELAGLSFVYDITRILLLLLGTY